MNKFDLHTHSFYSDGSESPAEIVRAASEAGVVLLALTDHDGISGVSEALEAGGRAGVRVLPGIEMDCAWTHELHILGLNVDPAHPALTAAIEAAKKRREARNETMIRQLVDAGYDIRPFLDGLGGSVTRLHMALALVDAGFAPTVREAFDSFLKRGCAGFVDGYRERCIPAGDAMDVIHAAGGLAVWAHPQHTPADLHKMTDMLADLGLDGIEAYHPSATEGGAELLESLASQHRLFVTCGSDFHGAHRPGVTLGCTWRDCPSLERTYRMLSGQ